jgi:hypothetical protein
MDSEEIETPPAQKWSDHYPQPQTIAALMKELQRARAKFPGNRFLLAALVEEVGKLAEAVLAEDKTAIKREALQVACVALRIAEEGDATEYASNRFIKIICGVGNIARALLQRSKRRHFTDLIMVTLSSLILTHDGDPTFDSITDEEAKK